MPFARSRGAAVPVTIAALVATLIVGTAATPAAAAARATAVRCAGDAAMLPAPSRTVAYRSLAGATFAQREAESAGRILRLGDETVSLRNFTSANGTIDGGVLGASAGGLVGLGATHSTVLVTPYSSTHKRDVPSGFPNTNQLDVLRVTGNAPVLRGFTIAGTAQGHDYNGLRVNRVTGLRASHLKVVGIGGSDIAPPGETFGINDFRTVGSRWSHVVVDGKGVGASGFGVNSSRDITICGTVSRNNAVAMGFALWQSSGIRLVDCTAIDNGFAGFNFERTSGTVEMIRPVAHGNRYDMRIASDQGSAKFRIVDPTLVNGVWTVWLPKRWYNTANLQRASDITLTVHGRSRPDLLRIRTY